jgi:hypothetical protein
MYSHLPPPCPGCRTAVAVLQIAYGFPTEETVEAAQRGEIVLGGCCWNSREMWFCRTCRRKFPDPNWPVEPAAEPEASVPPGPEPDPEVVKECVRRFVEDWLRRVKEHHTEAHDEGAGQGSRKDLQ